jgi:hypothetical protein
MSLNPDEKSSVLALDSDFLQLEHAKPLFKKYEILARENLYTYHTFMDGISLSWRHSKF